jgi:hypothetical protein
MTFDWQSKTFYIGFFGNTALAYATLETELQAWLWDAYVVEYDTGTFFNISRVDGQEITYSNPNLVRNISLTGYNEHARIDIIIDWVTYSLLGTTYSSSTSALDYLVTQLTGSTYFVKRETTNLVIARQDGAIPVISKTQYNRYTTEISYNDWDTPSSGQFPDNTITTIDGIQEFTSHLPVSRRFNGDWIIRNLAGTGTYTESAGSYGTGSGSDTLFYGFKYTAFPKQTIKKVTKLWTCTATRAVIRDSGGTILATANFSGNDATFNYTFNSNTVYQIGADSNGATYTRQTTGTYTAFYADNGFWLYELLSWNVGNIASIEVSPTNEFSGYTTSALFRTGGTSDTVWNPANKTSYFNKQHTFYIHKNDYSSLTVTSSTTYTNPWSFPNDNGVWYLQIETNNLADITITTYTEIIKTFTLLSNNFYIRTNNYPQYIKITAVSSGGTSEGEYKNRGQNTTARYGTTTENVQDLIFKTDASNFWNIVLIKRGGFVITWTTNTSNILTYTCK